MPQVKAGALPALTFFGIAADCCFLDIRENGLFF